MKANLTSKKTFLLTFLLLSLALAGSAQKLSIQGILKDANGKAVADGTQSITFNIYTSLTGGSSLWTETQSVSVFGGIYSALLGSVNTAISTLPWNVPYYVGITIAGQEITPRTELTYAPYALAVNKSTFADKLGTGNTNYASVDANGKFSLFNSSIGKFNIDNSGKARVGIYSGDVGNGTSSITLAVGDNDTGLNSTVDGNLDIYTNGSSKIGITPAGNVGIGLTSAATFQAGEKFAISNNAGTTRLGFYPGYLDNVVNSEWVTLDIGGNRGLRIWDAVSVSGNLYVDGTQIIKDNLAVGFNSSATINFAVGDADTGLRWNGDGDLSIMSNNVSRIKINPNGRIGINNNDPQTLLHVGNTANTNPNYTGGGNNINTTDNGGHIYYIEHDVQGVNSRSSLTSVVGMFEGDLVATGRTASAQAFTFSDKRIKNIQQISDSKIDLDILKKIEITDYKYIDTIDKGGNSYKKLIAQQVEKVYPQAVTQSASVIPNVYEIATKSTFANGELSLTTTKAHDFVKGDFIDLKTADKNLDRKEVIEVVNKHTFKIKSEIDLGKVFVYGKWVNDFRAVDYDAISMLNVSATQELIRKIEILEKENATLKNSNGQLKAEIDNTKKSQSALEARLGAIESQLNKTASN